jgi:hypothetical protein
MPNRQERLFWLHGRRLDQPTASQVDTKNRELVQSWSDCKLEYHVTVSADGVSDRLWLFRLGTSDQTIATYFNKRLKAHIDALSPIRLKRQVNLPTPLVARPVGDGHKIDIGLHVVNDVWNGALMMFFYYEGRYYNPPHLQYKEMVHYSKEAERLWTAAACSCHARSQCCPTGCWKCFQVNCASCRGTGWKDFGAWLEHGARIDYASGWPLAVV